MCRLSPGLASIRETVTLRSISVVLRANIQQTNVLQVCILDQCDEISSMANMRPVMGDEKAEATPLAAPTQISEYLVEKPLVYIFSFQKVKFLCTII
jgi:stage III sporulation protein SpoIIIAA